MNFVQMFMPIRWLVKSKYKRSVSVANTNSFKKQKKYLQICKVDIYVHMYTPFRICPNFKFYIVS